MSASEKGREKHKKRTAKKTEYREKKNEKKKEKRKLKTVLHLYKKALGLMRRESGAYMAIVSFQCILTECSPYWDIWFSAKLLDEVLGDRSLRRLVMYAAIMLGGNLLLVILKIFVSGLVWQSEEDLGRKQNMIFAGKLMDMDYGMLEEEKTHTLHQRVMWDTFNERKNLEVMCRSLPWLIGSLAGVGLSVAMVWELLIQMRGYGILTALFGVLAALGVWVSGKCQAVDQRLWTECNQSISDNIVRREGYLSYFGQYERGKEIRIYQIGKLMIDRLMATHHINDRALDECARRRIPFGVASDFAEEATVAMTYCLTGLAALTGRITVGDMTRYTGSISRLIGDLRFAWMMAVQLWYNADYLERYFEFLDMPCHMKKGCLPVEKRVDGEYRIVFDHVSFRYPGSEKYALKDISLEFRVGEKMAVVGMNGSGKTTFIKLLCRLYDPTEGTIFMNGIDIRRYNYEEYLSLFSVVFQDFQLFSFTLGENVAVAEDFQEETVEDALRKAGMTEFLAARENGLQTVLYRDFDRDGVEVSGGEAQKIALARAVCKGAPFVLLDEPTAALDPLAEYEIYKRFNDLVADRTTVYISHRMSSCRFCGDIAVFHEGQVVQRGSHEVLMNDREGKYYELWTAQARYYTEAS